MVVCLLELGSCFQHEYLCHDLYGRTAAVLVLGEAKRRRRGGLEMENRIHDFGDSGFKQRRFISFRIF